MPPHLPPGYLPPTAAAAGRAGKRWGMTRFPGLEDEYNGERGAENPAGNGTRTSFQRPSGRNPLRTDAPVVCPKRQTTGYCPAPIRAKANSEEPKFHPPFMGTCTEDQNHFNS
ncbi:MAG: hypothetical protein HY774_05565 [Acidobacteria bacterium]|nr:hypothetical protein [Acidobacteriota bacterium]